MSHPDLDERIGQALERLAWAFWKVHRRYPLLLQASKHIDLVRQRQGPGYVFNDGALQLLLDSFDMFVIDLASIREGLIERRGLFELLKQQPNVFRLHNGEDFEGEPRDLKASQVNAALLRLSGGAFPVTGEHIEALTRRFMADTEPIDRDRNRARAHRYEQTFDATGRYFLSLETLEHHVSVMGTYVHDLHLALAKQNYRHDALRFNCDDSETARDLADLVVHGSINSATIAYGLAPPKATQTDAAPWYWSKRDAWVASTEIESPHPAKAT